MFAKLSIRAKLIAVISFLLVAMISLGLLAISQMQALNTNATDIQSNWLPSVRLLGELRTGVTSYRSVLREHMLAETDDEKAAQEKTLQMLIDNNLKIREAYEKQIASAEERALYDDWVKTWDEYKKGAQEVVALSRKNTSTSTHDAHELNMITVNLIGLKADKILEKSVDLNNKGADKAGAQATSTYRFGFMIVSAILAICTVLGIAVGVYLIRDVSKGIASVIHPMRALGDGDLAVEIPHQGENTEIGTMATALQAFKEALIAKRAADEAAAHDADAKIQRSQRVDSITREFESMIGELVDSLSSSSTELEAAANTLTSTAETTGEISSSAATASQEVSSNVQSVSVATEQITSSVAEISRQVQESSRIANEAVRQAQTTDTNIVELSQAAARIRDVVKLITAVAEQTNLLATPAAGSPWSRPR